MSVTVSTPTPGVPTEHGPGERLRLRITAWPDPMWAAASAGAPPTVTPRWVDLAPRRLPGDLATFTLSGADGVVVGLTGVVAPERSPNDRLDPYAILSGRSVHQGLATEGPHPWRGLTAGDVYPCLLLMSPHYECLPVGPAAGSGPACRRLVAALLDWAGRHGVRSVVAQYLTPEAEALVAELRAAGFDLVELASRCDLPVSWESFDGYLATLSSKRRVTVRRELRALAELGVELAERRLADQEPELVRLRCQLVVKYGNRPDPVKETALLDRIRTTFAPEDVSVFTASRHGALLGFGLFVRQDAYWVPLMSGVDYADPGSRLTYFATLFYRPAALAPLRGVAMIPYGLGSWKAKRLRGCRPHPLYAAARLVAGAGTPTS